MSFKNFKITYKFQNKRKKKEIKNLIIRKYKSKNLRNNQIKENYLKLN